MADFEGFTSAISRGVFGTPIFAVSLCGCAELATALPGWRMNADALVRLSSGRGYFGGVPSPSRAEILLKAQSSYNDPGKIFEKLAPRPGDLGSRDTTDAKAAL